MISSAFKTTLVLLSACIISVNSFGSEPVTADSSSRRPVRIGAVAYAPSTVTVFQGVTGYLNRHGFHSDYVLYSNYDSLVSALDQGEVDIAWNTPLAHGQFHVKNQCASQTLVMRDVDCNVRSVLVARADAGITSLDDLNGKRLVLGSPQAAEATVLPLHFLKKEGVTTANVTVVSLEKEVDNQGNPCDSPRHVLAALSNGRADAGIITSALWNHIKDEPTTNEAFREVWVSPPFSHCVFTASAAFDAKLAARFIELMTRMDPRDPSTSDVMRLEGALKWLPGSPDGFASLVEALRENSLR